MCACARDWVLWGGFTVAVTVPSHRDSGWRNSLGGAPALHAGPRAGGKDDCVSTQINQVAWVLAVGSRLPLVRFIMSQKWGFHMA